MSSSLHEFDRLFKNAIGEHEDEPSPDVWENIDRHLAEKAVKNIHKKYYRLRWAAAALFLFSCGMAMYAVHTREQHNDVVQRERSSKINLRDDQSAGASRDRSTIADDNDASATQDRTEEEPAAGLKSEASNVPTTFRQGLVKTNATVSTAYLKGTKARQSVSKNSIVLENVSTGNDGFTQMVAIKYDAPADADFFAIQPVVSAVTAPGTSFSESPELKIALPGNTLQPLVSNMMQRKVSASPGNRKSNGFYVNVFVSPEFVYNKVKQNVRLYREDDRNEIKRNEKAGFSNTFGALAGYRFNSGWGVESGLTITNTLNNIEERNIYARPDRTGTVRYRINCAAGYSYVPLKTASNTQSGDSIKAVRAMNELQYLSVPVSVKYQLPIGRFSLSPGVGLTANILRKATIETEVKTNSATEKLLPAQIEGLKNVYLSSNLSLSAEYRLSNLLAISVIPTARFALESINNEGPVKSFQNSIGVATGLSLRF